MIFENPLTRESLVVEVPGRVARRGCTTRFSLPPNQGGPPPHYHERYDETFEVLEGELSVRVGDEIRVLRPGERCEVRAGVVHTFSNASSSAPVVFRTEVSHGHGFERFIRGWYGLAIDGRSSASGPRNLLELAVLIEEGDVNLPLVPRFVQLALRGLLVALAKRTGAYHRITAWWMPSSALPRS